MSGQAWLIFCAACAVVFALPSPLVFSVASYAAIRGRKTVFASVSGGALGIVAVGFDDQSRALSGGQRHQAHDAFAIHTVAIFGHGNFGLKFVGHFHKSSGGTGVQSGLIGYNQLSDDSFVMTICFHR